MREYASVTPQTGLKPFIYSCALCGKVFHSSEWVKIHDPRICEECKTFNETYSVCRLCGAPMDREGELCGECKAFVLQHAEGIQ